MCFFAATAASSMRGCSKGGVAIITASISGAASSFSKSLYFFGILELEFRGRLFHAIVEQIANALTRARGSALKIWRRKSRGRRSRSAPR